MKYLRTLYHSFFSRKQRDHRDIACYNNYDIVEDEHTIEIWRAKECIKIAKKHRLYVNDICLYFDYYFTAVEAVQYQKGYLVDYSTPRVHKVKGFEHFSVMFPSFAEPFETTQQYLAFANLDETSIVLDLGAYSGLTSIAFDWEISKGNPLCPGKVIAVEADKYHIPSMEYNFEQYKKQTGRDIMYIHSACTQLSGNFITFSSEGNMGSSLVDFVGKNRNSDVETIPTVNLSSIARDYNLNKVDFIKCDIEGSECFIFQDSDFFKSFAPRIVVETHYTHYTQGELTSHCVQKILQSYGYRCREVPQVGVYLPLLECVKD